jgi:hypothetical protein
MSQASETREIKTLTTKVTIELHRVGNSIAAFLPKDLLKAISPTAFKLKNMTSRSGSRVPWLVEFSIRQENGKIVLIMEEANSE